MKAATHAVQPSVLYVDACSDILVHAWLIECVWMGLARNRG